MERSIYTFRQILGTRIDSLEIAIQEYEAGEVHAEETLRRLIRAVREPAESLGRDTIVAAGLAAEAADSKSLAAGVRNLIGILRDEAAGINPRRSRILAIGLDTDFAGRLTAALETPSRLVLSVPEGEAALRVVSEQVITCIIICDPLADMRTAQLVAKLKSGSQTAGIPLLILTQGGSREVKEHVRIATSDLIMEGSIDTERVIKWCHEKLRRLPDGGRVTHRDLLTGLLNQAAFQESFTRVKEDCLNAHEPLTVALISVDQSRKLLDAYDADVREDILQSIGLVLSTSLRASDVVARWGLYEFAILFPGEDVFGGKCGVEKVVDRIKETPIPSQAGKPGKLQIAAAVESVSAGSLLDGVLDDLATHVKDVAERGGDAVYSPPIKPSARKSQRILVLNNEATTNMVLQRFFDGAGLETRIIEAGEGETIRALESQRFHVIVIDESFPPEGGLSVLHLIRRDGRYSRVPILYLIKKRSDADDVITQALEGGASECLIRPFSPTLLMERIERLITRNAAPPGDDACRILVVDPDLNSLVLAASALHRKGIFRVLLSRSCEDATARMKQEKVHAVLAGIDPGGSEVKHLLACIKENNDLSGVDLILWTDAKKSSVSQDALCGTIKKSLSSVQLPGAVAKLLEISENVSSSTPGLAEHLNHEIQRVSKLAPAP